MPGFIDVSNMTSEEVRRLGHADDYDEETNKKTYLYRNKSAYRRAAPKKPAFSYDADRVWGAAVVAFRANKGYVKAIAPGTNQSTNRQLMEQLLQDNVPLLEADLEEGRKMRLYFKGITFKLLEGQTLSPFLRNTMEIAGNETITNNLGIGTIASLPATYAKMTERDNVERKIKWAQGGLIGAEGDTVNETIELVKRIWSEKWNTWYYTGLTKEDQVLFFAHKGELKIGEYVTIEGKVKSHRDNATQLNRVKVIENV
jgi:hypothetical protein